MLFETPLLKLAFRGKVRKAVWRRLEARCRRKLPLYEGIERFRDNAMRQGRRRLALVYSRMLEARSLGLPFAEALEGIATREERAVLCASERGGRLSEGFALAAELLQARSELSSALKSGLAYPCFLCLLSVAVVAAVALVVVPQLSKVLDPKLWEGGARALYLLSSFVVSKAGAATGTLLAAASLACAASLPRWTGAARKAIDSFGPYGVYKSFVGAGWLFQVSTLMKSGMLLRDILSDCLKDQATSPFLKERVAAIAREYGAGKNLGQAMLDAGYDFPSKETAEDVLAYCEIPDAQERLLENAKEQLSEDLARLKSKIHILGGALMLLVFSLAVLCVFGVLSFQQQFQASV